MPTARVQLAFTDGSVLSEWQGVSVRDSFPDPIGEFRLSTAPVTAGGVLAFYRQKLRKGELVAVRVNDVPQFVGLIQTVEKTIGDGGVTFEVSGGTPLLTPYEGAAIEDPNDYTKELSFKSENADVPVRDLVLRAMAPYGFAELVGDDGSHVDLTSGKKRKKKGAALTIDGLTQREAIAHPGETAYQLLSRVVTRLGVCLKVRWDGVLYLTRPDYDQEIAYTVGQSSSESFPGDRFFGDIKIRDTNEGQFSEVCVRGQTPDEPDATLASRPVAVVQSSAINADRPPYRSDVAVYKPKVIKDKSARDRSRSESTAKLALGLAASSAFTVSGTVGGWVSKTGRIWTTNTLARVVVEKDEIDETMFLLSRTLIQDVEGGQSTQLTFVPKGYVVLGDLPGGD
jgi:prophage tail gpP-like protein